jgi:predicted molibdopterin-dependent oxidoreductase YjgC
MPDLGLTVNGREVRIPSGSMVAAAVALAGIDVCRHSVRGEARAPLCGMGICFECRVTIDGQVHRLGCQTPVEDGMTVVTT